jgi:hypothetical protein
MYLVAKALPHGPWDRGLSSSQRRVREVEGQRHGKLRGRNGQMKTSRQAENAIARDIKVKLVHVATTLPEQLYFIVQIAHCGSQGSHTTMETVARVEGGVESDLGETEFECGDEFGAHKHIALAICAEGDRRWLRIHSEKVLERGNSTSTRAGSKSNEDRDAFTEWIRL